jgi:hypothetical protein
VGSRKRSWRTIETTGVKAERGVRHTRMQRLSGDDGIVDRRTGRKNAGKKRMQCAAIIGMVRARAGVPMRAPFVVRAVSMMAVGMAVTSVRSDGPGSRIGLRQRRRNNARKLGGQKQDNQEPNRARLCPEPLHDSSGRSGNKRHFRLSGGERQSSAYDAVHKGKTHSKSAPKSGAGWFLCGAGLRPFPYPTFSSKDPPRGRKTWRASPRIPIQGT